MSTLARVGARSLLAFLLIAAVVFSSDNASASLPEPDYEAMTKSVRRLYRQSKAYLAQISQPSDEVYVDPPPENAIPTESPPQLGTTDPPEIPGPKGFVRGVSEEIPEARGYKTKTYQNPDGTKTTDFYTIPIHFRTQAGFEQVDATFTASPGGYSSKGDYANFVPNDGRDAFASVTGTAAVRLTLEGAATATAEVAANEARYRSVFPGTDLVVDSAPYAIKSSLIIADAQAASLRNTWRLRVDSTLTPVASPDGGINYVDATGAVILSTPKGIATDATARTEDPSISGSEHGCGKNKDEGRGSEQSQENRQDPGQKPVCDPLAGTTPVMADVVSDTGGIFIEESIDPAWLASPDRVYPIAVDPALNWLARADTFISNSTPDQNYWNYQSNGIPGHLGTFLPVRRTGYHPSYGNNKILFWFTPDDLQQANFAQIIDANFTTWAYYDKNPGAHPWIQLPNSDWDPYTVTWNNQPSVAPLPYIGYMDQRDGSWMTSHAPMLTEAVQKWEDGTWTSRGIEMSGGSEEYKLVASAFDPDSGKWPRLGVTFNTPPDVAFGTSPADGATLRNLQPAFAHAPANDPDGNQVWYQIRITTNPDGRSGQVISSNWTTDAGASFQVPPGTLRDDQTYFWGVWTSDGAAQSPSEIYRPAPPGWLRSFRIDALGTGAKPGYSIQSYPIGSRAAFGVNAESGNVIASVPLNSLPTATEPFSASLQYNSHAISEKGLNGTYYQWSPPRDATDPNQDVFDASGLRLQRLDSQVAFDWGVGQPLLGGSPDDVSIRWTGYVIVPADGQTHYFGVRHDDGVRVWVGKEAGTSTPKKIIDNWADSAAITDWSTTGFTAGIYPITIEYYERALQAVAELRWRTDTTSNGTVITGDYLRPEIRRLPAKWELKTSGGGGGGPTNLIPVGNDVEVIMASGAKYTFTWKDGRLIPPKDLERDALYKGGNYAYVAEDQTTYFFDLAGKPLSVISAPNSQNQASSFMYIYTDDAYGRRLAQIRDLAGQQWSETNNNWVNPGRAITFEYFGTSASEEHPGMLKTVKYWDGTQSDIEYGPGGGLKSVTAPGGAKVQFSYGGPNGYVNYGWGARSFDESPTPGVPVTLYRTEVEYVQGTLDPRLFDAIRVRGPAPGPGEDRPVVNYSRGDFGYPRPLPGAVSSANIIDPTNKTTQLAFDSARRVIGTTDPGGLETLIKYDAAGRVIEATGPDGSITRPEYDSRGRVIGQAGPKKDPVTGELIRSKTNYDEGINGALGTYFTNTVLSGVSSAKPGPELVRTDGQINFDWGAGSPFSNNANAENFSARWSGEIDVPVAGGYRFTANVDDGVRMWLGGTQVLDSWIEAPPRDVLSAIYELPQGRVPFVLEYKEHGGGAKIQLDWDAPCPVCRPRERVPVTNLKPGYGLVTSAESPDGSRVNVRYDGADPVLGLPSLVVGESRGDAGQLTTFSTGAEYDEFGRPTKVVRQPGASDPAQQITTYEYWGLNETISPLPFCASQGASSTPVLQAGLPKRENAPKNGSGQPPGKADSYGTYDSAGRIVSARLFDTVQPPESAACITYDARGRRVRATPPIPTSAPSQVDGAKPVDYTYNGDDALLSADDDSGGAVFQDYDRLGRLKSHTDANHKATVFEYDLAGRPTTATGPAGDRANSYFPDGRLETASWTAEGIGTQSVDYSYDWAGRLSQSSRSNSTSTTYSYGPVSEITGIKNSGPGGVISSHTYGRDRLGRIVEQFGPEGKSMFSYDDAGRLERVGVGAPTGPSATERLYTFDSHTNRSKKETWTPKVRMDAPGTPAPGKYGPTGTWRYNPHSTIFASPSSSAPIEDARLVYGPDTLGEYSANVGIKFHAGAVDGGVDLKWRNGGDDRLIVAMRAGDTTIHKIRGGVPSWSVETVPRTHTTGVWYQLRVETFGGHVKVFENGALVIDYTDPDATDAKAGYDQGAVALNSYNSWTEFGGFTVNDASGAELVRDAFGQRVGEGDWRPDGGELKQLQVGVPEPNGIVINGSYVTGDFETRADIRFDAGTIDGGIRFKRDPATGRAYTLALTASESILFAPDGTMLQVVGPTPRVLGRTYSIRIKMTGNFVEFFQDGVGVWGWTVPTPVQASGEVAPYSWLSAMTIRSLAVLPLNADAARAYEYNNTDQMTKEGTCLATADCIAYDYRGNTTKSGTSLYKFDTSNRLTWSKSTPELAVPTNPIAVSPNGHAIAISSNRDGNDEIYVMAPNGAGQNRLTNNPASDADPKFSPDNSKIVFSSDRDNPSFDIYQMNADGTDVRRVTNSGAGGARFPTYSPDGSMITYSSTRDAPTGTPQVYVMNVATEPFDSPTSGHPITALTSTGAWTPVWSPNGAKIAFSEVSGASCPGICFGLDFELAVISANGTGYQSLTNSPTGHSWLPAWSPDGSKIAFSSSRDTGTTDDIYRMNADGSAQTRLTTDPGQDFGPVWSPDGAQIYFVSDRAGIGPDLYRINGTDGSGTVRITTGAMVTTIPSIGVGFGSGTQAVVHYSYDALGRMAEMTSTQGAFVDQLKFGYSGPTDSYSYISRGGEIQFRIFSGAEGLYATATKTGATWAVEHFYFDARGDTRATANQSGNVTFTASYDEYGNQTSTYGAHQPYEFMGKFRRFFNPLTGLVHLGARMYQPKSGRFLSRDPITGGSANDYEYAGGDPMNWRDLSGTERVCVGVLMFVICTESDPDKPSDITVPGGRFRPKPGGGGFVYESFFGGLDQRALGSSQTNRRYGWFTLPQDTAGQWSWRDLGTSLIGQAVPGANSTDTLFDWISDTPTKTSWWDVVGFVGNSAADTVLGMFWTPLIVTGVSNVAGQLSTYLW